MSILILPIFIPLVAAVLILATRGKPRGLKEALTLVATAATLAISVQLFGKEISFILPWIGHGIDLSLRLDRFSGFIVLFASLFAFLTALYSVVSMRGKDHPKQFYFYLLIILVCTNAAVLANNLIFMLFFWEGILLAIFGMIAIGNKNAFKTATKAFIIVGISDLCMMGGLAITGYLASTLTISQIHLELTPLASIAFVLLMIGAIAKGGSMPFHSWIPSAATDAPLPFMALMPAALEKLLGIYFLSRITLEMFKLSAGSWISITMMTIGAATIILAVMMALVQKEYKRLLSYHAISQVGYMILGIGTCVPAGIIGGIFHMVNNALYKSCLFFTAGSVEKQAGTTDLERLGGLWKQMPITFACFVITALSISGVPPFNGFFSKELIYDGALERGKIFYLAALIGSFFTAASFLKLGHAAFCGKASQENRRVKEAPLGMLVPMAVIAFLCILFGVYNQLPIEKFIQPILGHARLEGHNFSGFPANAWLTLTTIVVLIAALIHHLIAAKAAGSGLKASEHIHHAPVLGTIYQAAERKWFDPYEVGMKVVHIASLLLMAIDRIIDWLYDGFLAGTAFLASRALALLQTGNYVVYIVWSLVSAAVALAFMVK
ncbi:MAG: proton-conducting transporter membrane subunit [Candidatus Omnitrophica bacterium]|nr:proton-conducting transporter membrane subunit [Candidatus Omnitrophota bacterium]MDD5610257.1 proton-conducting transporter membrane subunit [Candidatus Omnitrophota bacterium]